MSSISRPDAAPAVSGLDAHLGYWLRAVSNRVSSRFAQRVEGEGVTVAEWVVLRELYDSRPVKPSALAASLGLTRGAVSKLVDRLHAKGLVRVRDDVADARAQRVALTAAGQRLVPVLAAHADANDAEAFAGLTPSERTQLRAVCERLVAQLGGSGAAMD